MKAGSAKKKKKKSDPDFMPDDDDEEEFEVPIDGRRKREIQRELNLINPSGVINPNEERRTRFTQAKDNSAASSGSARLCTRGCLCLSLLAVSLLLIAATAFVPARKPLPVWPLTPARLLLLHDNLEQHLPRQQVATRALTLAVGKHPGGHALSLALAGSLGLRANITVQQNTLTERMYTQVRLTPPSVVVMRGPPASREDAAALKEALTKDTITFNGESASTRDCVIVLCVEGLAREVNEMVENNIVSDVDTVVRQFMRGNSWDNVRVDAVIPFVR